MDADYHSAICDKTNTRNMIHINMYLLKMLHPILEEFSSERKGVINVRSYSHIICIADSIINNSDWSSEINVYNDQFIVRLTTNDEDSENYVFFITFVPLDEWLNSNGKQITVTNNNYSEKMIINMHLEGMNKPQLFRLPIF